MTEKVVKLADHKPRKPRAAGKPKPPPGPAEDGAELLRDVWLMLCRYVVFPSPAAGVAVTLYAAATHAAHELQFATRLVIRSPEKRCGKSRLLEVLASLVARPLMTVNISPAALVHSITEYQPPTIIQDEADTVFGKSLKGDEKAEMLRGLLNAGFGRGAPYLRWDITAKALEECPTFAMAVLAGIGSMPDTIEDRAVVISMRRKAPGESAERYRYRRDKPAVQALGLRLARWVIPQARAIGDAAPQMPDGLNDRQEDAWESLIAVADAAGGDWPEWARRAAQDLCSVAEEKSAFQRRLLPDLREIFDRSPKAEKLRTQEIIDALADIEEAPWAEYHHGREPITGRELAGLLSSYEVKSRDAEYFPQPGKRSSAKHYFRADLEPVWASYVAVADQGPEGVSATAATALHRRSKGK